MWSTKKLQNIKKLQKKLKPKMIANCVRKKTIKRKTPQKNFKPKKRLCIDKKTEKKIKKKKNYLLRLHSCHLYVVKQTSTCSF
jgi:hypothetical protein